MSKKRRLGRPTARLRVVAGERVDPELVYEAMNEDEGAFVYYDGEYREGGAYHDDLIHDLAQGNEDLEEAMRAVHYNGWSQDLKELDPGARYFDGRLCTLPDGRTVGVVTWYSLVNVSATEAGSLLRSLAGQCDAALLEDDRCRYEVVASKGVRGNGPLAWAIVNDQVLVSDSGPQSYTLLDPTLEEEFNEYVYEDGGVPEEFGDHNFYVLYSVLNEEPVKGDYRFAWGTVEGGTATVVPESVKGYSPADVERLLGDYLGETVTVGGPGPTEREEVSLADCRPFVYLNGEFYGGHDGGPGSHDGVIDAAPVSRALKEAMKDAHWRGDFSGFPEGTEFFTGVEDCDSGEWNQDAFVLAWTPYGLTLEGCAQALLDWGCTAVYVSGQGSRRRVAYKGRDSLRVGRRLARTPRVAALHRADRWLAFACYDGRLEYAETHDEAVAELVEDVEGELDEESGLWLALDVAHGGDGAVLDAPYFEGYLDDEFNAYVHTWALFGLGVEEAKARLLENPDVRAVYTLDDGGRAVLAKVTEPTDLLDAPDARPFLYYEGELLVGEPGASHFELIYDVAKARGNDEFPGVYDRLKAAHRGRGGLEGGERYFDGHLLEETASVNGWTLNGVSEDEAKGVLLGSGEGVEAVYVLDDFANYREASLESQTAFVYYNGEVEYGDVHAEAIEYLARGDEALEDALTRAHWEADFSGLPEGARYFDGFLEEEYDEDDVDFLEPKTTCRVYSYSVHGLTVKEALREAEDLTAPENGVEVVASGRKRRRV